MILSNPRLEPPNHIRYGHDATWEAPELANYRYLDMFLKLAQVAAQYGLLVLMVADRTTPKAHNGLWYDGVNSEDKVLESWGLISDKLCSQWNVFGVDLQQEPHKASWGKGSGIPNDWGLAAERIGNRVLTDCARWLIFVQGVGYWPGSPGMDSDSDGIWFGENLGGVKTQPVVLLDQSKLVYAPHSYGPATFNQKPFASPNFPENLPAIWDKRFGFVREQTGAPVVFGEMGGLYDSQGRIGGMGKDETWQKRAVQYAADEGIGVFYFALQPSEDKGGLLKDDWSTPEAAKRRRLEAHTSTMSFWAKSARRASMSVYLSRSFVYGVTAPV